MAAYSETETLTPEYVERLKTALNENRRLTVRELANPSWYPANKCFRDFDGKSCLTSPSPGDTPIIFPQEDSGFSCVDRRPGYYADPTEDCKKWHWCIPGGTRYSFDCPEQTRFNQAYRVCDWWYNVDCSRAVEQYEVNADLYVVS
ncbi:U-scoloptoxin(01)-Er1a-like [Oratosquilla oratoria]|uniref:U-scoloptoxin(01)-Er1a-like n=1 Tax=Oratosquilla oratoria TaxID=337810 RepID=UPI003F77631F